MWKAATSPPATTGKKRVENQCGQDLFYTLQREFLVPVLMVQLYSNACVFGIIL